MGLSQGGQMLMMPDSPWTMMDSASGRVRATRAIRPAWRFSTPYRSTGQALSAYPLGTGACFTEASAGEDRPGLPVARRRKLGVAGVEGPDIVQLERFPSGKFLLISTDGGSAQLLLERQNMGGDGVHTFSTGECVEDFSIYGHTMYPVGRRRSVTGTSGRASFFCILLPRASSHGARLASRVEP